MSDFRCDMDVAGDLVLPPGTPSLTIGTPKGFSITLTNGPSDEDGHPVQMRATIIGPSESLETARDDLREVLSDQLNLLTFVTHSRFRILKLRRLMEWDEGKRSRSMKAFHAVDSRYPPDPQLDQSYLDTVSALDEVGVPDYVRTALKYFRYGLLDDQPEDQFMRIWSSLEIIAENTKGSIRVPIPCSECNADMVCSACGMKPTRVPMAKQAIQELIEKIVGDKTTAAAISKRQFIARNGLVHGRSVESIEEECGIGMGGIVNEMGTLAWHAIMSAIPLGPGPGLAFGHRDGEFVQKTMVAAITMLVEFPGDEPHPSEDKIPSPDIKLITSFDLGSGPGKPSG